MKPSCQAFNRTSQHFTQGCSGQGHEAVKHQGKGAGKRSNAE